MLVPALLALLLLLVGLLAVGALGYAVYRHPDLKGPLTVALTAGTLLVASFSAVATAAAR
ncbi:hypothetical protein ABZ820_33770 [Streptomyces diacarni]|uniref:hypothetical protein n=1 Tax=Streptomyces diacarni TaxID=2800381 RepID=UPI0033F40601